MDFTDLREGILSGEEQVFHASNYALFLSKASQLPETKLKV